MMHSQKLSLWSLSNFTRSDGRDSNFMDSEKIDSRWSNSRAQHSRRRWSISCAKRFLTFGQAETSFPNSMSDIGAFSKRKRNSVMFEFGTIVRASTDGHSDSERNPCLSATMSFLMDENSWKIMASALTAMSSTGLKSSSGNLLRGFP